MEKTIALSAKDLANGYLGKNSIVGNFDGIPINEKLSILQKTPKQFIKIRKVGGKDYRYCTHQYAKKALNFCFAFDVSNEVVSKEYLEYTEEYNERQKDGSYKKKSRRVIEAECTIMFTFLGGKIKRTVHSSHKGFPNPATTRGDIMQSALSKAWTKAAQTFGMATEEEVVKIKEEPKEEEFEVTTDQPAKTFINQPY